MTGVLEILCPHTDCEGRLRIRYDSHDECVLRCICHACWVRLAWDGRKPKLSLTEAPSPVDKPKAPRRKRTKKEPPPWMVQPGGE